MFTLSFVYSLTIILFLWGKVSTHDFRGFDDTILFKINWPGNTEDIYDQSPDAEPLFVTTHNKEKYKCLIPQLQDKESDSDTAYSGPTPLELLSPLFTSSSCSYRIESYWTYEICHGSYIKQYHEEREGKSVKLQDYFLGKWTDEKTEASKETIEKDESDELKYRKIDGLNLPYYEMEMVDGTICDLNNEARTTKVLYVCYAHGKNEVYSLKETSTCNYEVVILTQALCIHPKYRPQETGENLISCLPLDESPKRPRSLMAMEVEGLKMRYQKLADAHKSKDTIAVLKVDPKDGTLRMEIIQGDLGDNKLTPSIEGLVDSKEAVKIPKISESSKDTSQVEAFLQGKNCLTGGTGWWKFEFCYGRYVRQYHLDKDGETSIILGFFDETAHKDWIKTNPLKRPKAKGSRTQLIHFYQGGSLCEKTGKKRQTEVKLKCLENSASPSSVSLYLLEPQTCHYLLGVESPLICEILNKANEDGLVPKEEMGFEDESPAEYIVGEAVIDDVRFEND